MGRQSSAFIIIISFALLFSLLYISSSLLPRPVQRYNDISEIPTEPKISQLEALEIAVQAVKKDQPDLNEDDIRLWGSLYNFSEVAYEKHPEKYAGYPWTIATVKQHPDLLDLLLAYFHPNGTVYYIDYANGSYDICDACSRANYDFRDGRLLWRVDMVPQPVDVDAETGEIVWPNFDPNPFPPNVQIYENVTSARTAKQMLEAKLNPPETTQVDIMRVAAEQTSAKSHYRPDNARGTLEISNKVRWTNSDIATHTVTSDNGYSNPYTGEFDSGRIMPNAIYEYAFMDVGEYSYHCEIHPWMRGEVEIVPSFV